MKTSTSKMSRFTGIAKQAKNRGLYLLLAAIMLSLAPACKKGGGVHNCDIRADMDAVTAAAQAFSSNQSVENCEAAKKANLKLLQKADKCPNLIPSDLKETIEEMKNVDCSEYE